MRTLLLLLAAGCASAQGPQPALRIDRDDSQGRVVIADGDHEIVTWQYGQQFAIPHWFPLKSPSGKDLVAQHPDPYPHHRALWLADKVQLEDGPVVDFYHCFQNQLDKNDASKGYRHFIRQRAMPRCEAHGDRATLAATLQWLVGGEQPVL
ncbi:MAG: PmoA family protein, partial [Planctomycetes bacterium]|nr:PmoA family protein [Planctomycetota bacterium]